MKLSKKIISLLFSLILMISLVPSALAADAAITIKIDGATVSSDTAPVVEKGTTLVPVRVITEYLGADVTWNSTSRQATVKTAGYTVVFTIDSSFYTVNGTTATLPVAAKIINNRTMIPLRALSEAIGAEVDYLADSHTAVVNYFSNMTGSIKITGSTTVQPISQAAADKLIAMNKGLSISVSGGGSGAGIKDTNNGANDIGESSRDLTADESKNLSVFTVANDGIAIIVNPKNGVSNLTIEQAKKIFLGEIKNWSEVGGKDAPILVQTRETGSGTLATLEELLLDKAKVVSTATPYASTALLKQAVAASENAIGFISVGFVDSTVKTLSINYISPTVETITDASYPISRKLYVFTKGTPTKEKAMFIDYLRSEYCQKNIVAEEGYIPVK
jgi:phosphate transport system substrate-binding protein